MPYAPRTVFTTFASLMLMASTSFSQTATTVPVGFVSTTLPQNSTTAFGVPLLNISAFTGRSSQVTSVTISFAGVTWTPGQFATPSAPHFLLITSGAQAGRTLFVTANDATSLTVDVGATNLDAAGFAMIVGDSIDLFRGDTLATLFGATADQNGLLPSGLSGGSSLLAADTINIHNGTRFVPYFFNTTLGSWVMQNGGNASQNNVILYPEEGILIVHKGTTDATLTLTGRVPSTRLLTELYPNINNAIAIRFPTTVTLGTLNFTGPGTWNKGNSVLSADTVNIWNGTRWVPYYQNTSNQWIQNQGDGTDQSNVVIPAGTAIMIGKKNGGAGSMTFYSQVIPYSLN